MTLTAEYQPQANMKYWGAFMDEVLNFSIVSCPRPSDVTPDNVVYQPRLAIYGTDKRLLEAIQDKIINGRSWNLNDVIAGSPDNRRKEWYLITGNSVECFRFLQWVKPFLTFKQAQAEIFEELLDQKREVRRSIQDLVKVSALYSNPYERMNVEEDLQQRLSLAKRQVIPETSVPSQERLAGTVDATMSLGIYLVENNHRLEFIARGTIVSVRHSLLEALYKRYGGVKPGKRSDTSVTKVETPTYEWQVNGYNLGKLLTDVEPDLLFKKAQARFIIEFLRVRKALMSTRKFVGDPLINAQRAKVLQSFIEEWGNIDPLPS